MQNSSRRVAVIEAGGKNLQYWRDLWNYRALAVLMARRDITVRYKQTIVGFGWAFVSPLVSMFLNSFIFGSLAGFSEGKTVPYNIIVAAGFLQWGMFTRGFSTGFGVFRNSGILSKVYFPRLIIPLSSMTSAFFDTLSSYLLLFILMGFYRYDPPVRILLSFVLLIPMVFLGTTIGMFFGSFSVRWRDLSPVVPFGVTVLQYITPVAYSAADAQTSLGAAARFYGVVNAINPVAGFETAFKWAVLRGEVFDTRAFLVSCAWLAFFTVIGLWRFRKVERNFVHII